MTEVFSPPAQPALFCRHCKKVVPAQLDRSIAGNGRIVGRDSTFEYSCTKCLKSFCVSGKDLIDTIHAAPADAGTRYYSPKDLFLIGEVIRHKKLDDVGLVVGKDSGPSSRIVVQFEKTGLKKLIENFR